MRAGLTRNLKTIFAGEEAAVVTDDWRLAEWLATRDIRAVTFDEIAAGDIEVPRRALTVPLDWERVPSRQALRDTWSETAVLWLPLASFSSDLDAPKYSVEMFSEVDVFQSVAMNRRVITRLLMAREEITMTGPDTALKVRLPDTLHVVGRTRMSLLHDEHAALGNYFEVGMSPTDMAGNLDASMSVSGLVRVDSVLVAKHREIRGARASSFSAAADVADKLRRACPFQVTICDNRIVDGFGEWADEIDALSGPEYGAALTEVAVGTGALPLGRVDWSLNRVLNEGATGIHIGVGNGLNGMHFDFISTEARLDCL
ncbi:hypothetical protein PI87_25705 [Ralstonia sp. A12]|uniref:hypothetical protein n=1 Tax=Ralstonia sp. A12 TaxID=1217052 RepID=UPI0005731839|nr:hypothetical protein [Ralstonia sp. A12]KHK49415.1 hypothetical protein PI87_25705 [Ralstonia sp. A12]